LIAEIRDAFLIPQAPDSPEQQELLPASEEAATGNNIATTGEEDTGGDDSAEDYPEPGSFEPEDSDDADTSVAAAMAKRGWVFSQTEAGWLARNVRTGVQTTIALGSIEEAAQAADTLEWARDNRIVPGNQPGLNSERPVETPEDETESVLTGEEGAVPVEVVRDLPAPTSQQVGQLSLFDYSELNTETAETVRQATAEIKDRLVVMQKKVVEIGQRLQTVKGALERGQFDRWLASEVGFSRDTADRFIGTAELAARSPQIAENLDRFEKTALYKLISPSTPEEVVGEMGERAAAGEKITEARVKEAVRARMPATSEPQEPASTTDDADGPVESPQAAENAAAAEVVATGHTVADLVALLKTTANGFDTLYIVDGLGFSSFTLETGIANRLIERAANGQCTYSWKAEDVVQAIRDYGPRTLMQLEDMGCQRYAIVAAEGDGLIERAGSAFKLVGDVEHVEPAAAASPTTAPERAEKPQPRIEDLLKGRMLVVTFTYVPQIKGKVSVGVRLGSDATKAQYETIDVGQVRGFPQRVQEMIFEQLKGEKKKPAAKPDTKKPAARKRAAPKKVTKKAVARKPVARKKAAKKR
jgi:hypothetical protein